MIIVHDTFICKPGNAGKLAKLFKEVMGNRPETVNILSDTTGQYNRVIIVSKFDSLSAYEKSWETGDPEEIHGDVPDRVTRDIQGVVVPEADAASWPSLFFSQATQHANPCGF